MKEWKYILDREGFLDRLQVVIEHSKGQGKLAKKIGVSTTTISRWKAKNNAPEPDLKNLEAIERETGFTKNWLITGEGQPFPTHYTPPPGNAIHFNLGGQSQADQLEDTLAQIKRVQFKQACQGHLNELMDFIGDEFGEDGAGVRQFMAEMMESQARFSRWKRERESRATQTPQTGTHG